MKVIRVVKALGPIDLRSVLRDSLLRWMVIYPILLALALRWGAPALSERLWIRYQFDLPSYYVLLMSFMVELMPILVGMVIGFLLLDQRDDQVLFALQVTPLTLNGYLAYRIAAPLVVSVAITLAIFPIAALVEVGTLPLFLLACGAAPLAPIFALFLAVFARNKVEGFALTKASGMLFLPPVIAWFVPPGWQWLFGVIPTYWPVKAFWLHLAGESGWFIACLLAGLVYQALVLWLLLRRFNRVATRPSS